MNHKQFDQLKQNNQREDWLRQHPWTPELFPDGWKAYSPDNDSIMGPYKSEDIADKEADNLRYWLRENPLEPKYFQHIGWLFYNHEIEGPFESKESAEKEIEEIKKKLYPENYEETNEH